jgi:hypothetical protein
MNSSRLLALRRALTLIEIMLVVLCLFILLAPVLSIFRHGTRSSLKGMLHLETTMEARRILKQVTQDLRHSCFKMDGSQIDFSWSTLLQIGGSFPTGTYGMLRFPLVGELDATLPANSLGTAFRRASRITYRVQPHPQVPGRRQLVREEQYHPDHPMAAKLNGGRRSEILTHRLNLFDIKPEEVSNGKHGMLLFRVSLQLFDSVQGAAIAVPGDGPGPEVVIADFFAVAYSDFYHRLVHRDWFNPNWQTGVVGPP